MEKLIKYTTQQVRQMSWFQWNDTMAKELNAAGFKRRGINKETGRWEDNYEPFHADSDDPSLFIFTLKNANEYEYLKNIGLLNNGRCPMCGNPIETSPGRFTSGFDANVHFQICQNCCNEGKRISINPAHNSGCIITLLLMPWHLLKSLFYI